MTQDAAKKASVIKDIKRLRREAKPLNYSAVRKYHLQLLVRSKQVFGTWSNAVLEAGFDYEKLSLIQRWSKRKVIDQLKDLHKRRQFPDIRTLSIKFPKLYGACLRYFRTGRSALKAAGIEYQTLLGEHPYRWTRSRIIGELKRRYAEGETLCRSEILSTEPRFKRFCYAALNEFGTWSKALRVAGLNPDAIRNRDGLWPREKVLAGIRSRYEQGKFLNTDLMLREDLPLHAAGRRHFGTWKAAIEKAGINYKNVRGGLQGWSKPKTRRALRERLVDGKLNLKQLRDANPSLHRAAVHHFGSWESALREARRHT